MHGLTLKTLAIASCSICVAGLTGVVGLPNFNLDQIETSLAEHSIAKDSQPVSTKEGKVLKLFRIAEAHEINGDHEAALACYQDIIFENESPQTTWQAYSARAQIYEQQQKYDLALGEYSAFIKSAKPGILKALAYSHRMELYEKTGNSAQAHLDKDMIATMR